MMGIETTGMLGAAMQQDMFMRLLITQLQNQNPMDPMSNSEMVSQMAQLTTLDGINALNASFREVLKLQQLSSGAQLVGREVEYTDGFLTQWGLVESISTRGEAIKLVVNGHEIGLDSVIRVL
ncbi:MAG: flagellar hook capping protein [Candidatus Brocadiae bacterium]|nr:flagellar hook capping protein [Candidatus Brocadiia bacterium]